MFGFTIIRKKELENFKMMDNINNELISAYKDVNKVKNDIIRIQNEFIEKDKSIISHKESIIKKLKLKL